MAKQHLPRSTVKWGPGFLTQKPLNGQQPRGNKPQPYTKQRLRKTKPSTQPNADGKVPSEPNGCLFDGNSQIHLPREDNGSQKSSDPPESYPVKVETQYLLLKTKELTRVLSDYTVESCVVCGVKQRSGWLFTLFDDSWGLLCGTCGYKLSQKLSANN